MTSIAPGQWEKIARKAGSNLRWGRTHGWANLLEEHDLDPRVRIPRAVSRARWVLRHSVDRGTARPLFLVGVQRSGTNMIAHGLDQAPEVDVYNEGNSRAFRDYQLRGPKVVDRLVARSRRPFVLFKPLCDSDRTSELLDHAWPGGSPRAIWAYRGVEGRVRSHVLKFRSSNLDTFRRFVNGEIGGSGSSDSSWQVRGLSPESVELIHRLDVHSMNPETASALFWYVRNIQYFERGLDSRDDVTLASYDAFLAEPEASMRKLCDFIGFPFRPALVGHVQPQVRTPRIPVSINSTVRDLCAELEYRLSAEFRRQGVGTSGA